ncbi:MAG: dTMP kinase [Rikenellaceae bacterium]|jgi:dTMP kinase|nr:dTMP kinase [Rikenellaceae bacterium]
MAFIELEGLDGAGKSTQVALLTECLRARGIQYEYLHFPRFDAPFYGELIARFLRGEYGDAAQVDPYLVALLYAGDRNDAKALINGWLAEGKFVILDRYVYSNIAFQCAKLEGEARKKLMQWILDLEFGYNALPRPDVALFLDVPFAFTERKLTQTRKGDDRAYLNGGSDVHEQSLDLQRRVREVYMELDAAQADFRMVDCSSPAGEMLPPEDIFARVMDNIGKLL